MCVGRGEGEGEEVVATGRDKNGQLREENSQMTMVESNIHHNHLHERNDGQEIHL
jgi:hypothetical protein